MFDDTITLWMFAVRIQLNWIHTYLGMLMKIQRLLWGVSSFLCVWATWNVLYLKKGRSVKSLDEPGVRAHGQWHWPPAVCCMRRTHSRRTADWSPCRWSSPSSPSLRFQSLGWRSYLKWEWIVHELYVFIMIILNFLWMSTSSTSQLPLTLTWHIFESNADYESKQDCDIILPSLEME